MSVSVKNNNVEFAIKRFRTQVARDGILSKARERAEQNNYYKNLEWIKEEKKKNTINSRKNSKKNNRENY